MDDKWIDGLEVRCGVLALPPYRCRYCGLPSWREPADQTAPADRCHDADHAPACASGVEADLPLADRF